MGKVFNGCKRVNEKQVEIACFKKHIFHGILVIGSEAVFTFCTCVENSGLNVCNGFQLEIKFDLERDTFR